MTVVNDHTVPSILVQVGTPPPPPPRPPLPIESLEYLWYSQTGVGGIRDDQSTALMNLVTSKKNTGVAYVKEYTKNNVWANYFPANYTPGGQEQPEWVYGPDPADYNYSVAQLPGATLSLTGYRIAHEKYDGFPSGVYIPATKSVISTPLYCPDPGKNHNALLSYAGGGIYNPYYWNVIEENVSLATVEAALLAGLGRVPLLNPRPDGVIQVTPQSRTAQKPNVIQLNVTQLEGTFATNPDPGLIPEGNNFDDLEGNDDLNAFSVTLGIQPGCEDKSNEKLPWSIKFEFGEVEFRIEEGKPNATIRFTGQEPEDCPLVSAISQTTTHHMGERPYEIAFIPVYNGLLIGFGPPQSNTWAQQTLYFVKDKTKSAFQEVARILDLWTDTQEGKGKGKKIGSPAPTPGSPPAPPPPPPPLPPTVKAPVKRVPRILPVMPLGKNINPVELESPGPSGPQLSSSPGDSLLLVSPPPAGQSSQVNKGVLCLPENSTSVEMGKYLRVSYHRCGGVIQFRPLVFPACWRSVTLMKGTSQDAENPPKWESFDDLNAPKKPKLPGKPDPTKEIDKLPPIPVKNLEQVEKYRILPVVSYTKEFEYYAALKKLPGNDSSPVWGLVTEYRKFRRVKDQTKIQRDLYFRRPVESWGAFIYHLDAQEQVGRLGIKFKNLDGFLTVNDLPEPRVKSVQVNRSLDGCSGTVSWDRYDPVRGLVLRPPHNIGALRISVTGGVDTVGGVVFTGLGVGNTESNTTSDNTITVPIFGREYKIQDQGGIKLIETPYFDGFDIREVMQFLADYAGVPFLNLVKGNLRLPSGMFYAPLVDLRTGTPVWDGMVEAAKMVNCLPYFDRFGNLRLMEAAKTTGINWNYPATKVTSYQDTPDYSVVANAIVMQALVSSPESYQKLMRQSRSFGASSNDLPEISEPVFIIINLVTDPEFDWSKMAFYPFSGVFKDIDEFKRAAKIFAGAVSRYRSSGSIEIPGNAEIELLDTFNNDYVVTSIAHNIDTQQKTFRTSLTVERLTSINPQPVGELIVLPVTSF